MHVEQLSFAVMWLRIVRMRIQDNKITNYLLKVKNKNIFNSLPKPLISYFCSFRLEKIWFSTKTPNIYLLNSVFPSFYTSRTGSEFTDPNECGSDRIWIHITDFLTCWISHFNNIHLENMDSYSLLSHGQDFMDR